uniref:Dephospho-CoA kinase n=1 Tax=Chlorobium chlorochromatii (strain CaD3) TaxID=340177 RepID=COAE_CHLCH|nr:RecName: Full=Dephospho-CoA kinase; AltName: Full=Dephosphocoenzyme A kinase [Chlorobium chlorochromatii CaD3]
MESKLPLLVGVTGGLGSGKSMVCRYLASMGCALFEADVVAKELQVRDSKVIEGITALFGKEVYSYNPKGELQLNRKDIAQVVFSNQEKLGALNRLIHPRVAVAFQQACDNAARSNVAILVKEAAILFESGAHAGLDVVVVVQAATELRVERAVQKGLGTREEILRRLAVQWAPEKLAALADVVIDNNGTPEALYEKTKQLYEQLLQQAMLRR